MFLKLTLYKAADKRSLRVTTMSSDFDAQLDDPVIFLRKDAATTLVGFFFVTVMFFLVFYVIVVWDRGTVSAYSKVIVLHDRTAMKPSGLHATSRNESPAEILRNVVKCYDVIVSKRQFSVRVIGKFEPLS